MRNYVGKTYPKKKPEHMLNCKDCKYWLTKYQYRLGKKCWCCVKNVWTPARYYCFKAKSKA